MERFPHATRRILGDIGHKLAELKQEMIGGRRKVKLIFEDLLAKGVSEGALARVRATVGLDFGSESVPEIAVSVVAGLIARRNGSQGSQNTNDRSRVSLYYHYRNSEGLHVPEPYPIERPLSLGLLFAKSAVVVVSVGGAFALGHGLSGTSIPSWVEWFGAILCAVSCGIAFVVCPALLRSAKARLARQEAELRGSEARFRQLADALPQIVWIARPDGSEATYLNSRWKEYTGLDVSGQTVNHKVVHPDDLAAMAARFAESQKTGNVFECEFRMRPGETGPYLWFLARGVPVRNEAGAIVEWFGTSTDIDDIKSTQEALRESQRHFRELVESIPQLAWTDLPDGYCDYLSPQWVAYTGVPMKEHLGFGWVDAIHPDDQERAYADWCRSAEGGIPLENEFRIRRADGVYRWFKNRAIPLMDERGAISKWFGTNTDIEDLKCAEQRLHEAEARFHRTFDGMQEGCQIISSDWKYLYINESAARQGRSTPSELTGRTMMEAFPGIENSSFFPTLVECMIQRTPHRIRNRFEYPDGSEAEFELSIQPCPEGIFILSTELSGRVTKPESVGVTSVAELKDSSG